MALSVDLALTFVECRTWGHAWDWFVPAGRQPKWGTWVALRCDRCGTERYDRLGIYGQVEGRTYDYPEGYQLSGEVPTRDEFRTDLLDRLRAEAMERIRNGRTNGHRKRS